MNRLRLLPLLALLAFLPAAVHAAPLTMTAETQAWWNRSGIVVPTAVGSHVHVLATVPADGAIVDGKVTIPVRVTLHNQPAPTNWFRIGTESTQLYSTSLVLGPCSDCSVDLTAVIDLSGIPTGRHELRMSANIPDADPALSGSQRQYQSSGFQVCVRSCSPTYRSGYHTEARGWYTDHAYANAKLTTALSSVKSGGTIGVRLSPGSGGLPTKYAGVFIDPAFHAGSAGIVVRTWSAAFTGSVTLPTLASGSHRLVLLSSDGQNAGVLAIPWVQP
jgi:hypothetical protein